MYKNKLTLKILFFLISTDLLETFTQYCFKKSAIPQGDVFIKNFFDVFIFIKPFISSGFLWLGLFSVFLTFVIWSTILSKIDLSVAVPVASSSYILVPLASVFFLDEVMTSLDWTGILFIIAGVIIVSSSTKKEEIIIP
jgi:drug/metabolite transporter (DMT)-like permease